MKTLAVAKVAPSAVTGPARAATEAPEAEVKAELLTPEPGTEDHHRAFFRQQRTNSDEMGREEEREGSGAGGDLHLTHNIVNVVSLHDAIDPPPHLSRNRGGGHRSRFRGPGRGGGGDLCLT